MKTNYSRVCLVNSAYALFNYLLISTPEETKDTFFFFSDGIPQTCKDFFKEQCFVTKTYKNKFLNELYEIYIRFFASCKWPFLKNAGIYGMKAGPLFPEIIGNQQLTIVEEGSEFLDIPEPVRKLKNIRKLLHGHFYASHNLRSSHIQRLYLTDHKKDTPIMQQPNVISFNIKNKWNENKEKQTLILEAFGVTPASIQPLKAYTNLLLTQTFSEDLIMTIEEEIQLYKNLIAHCNLNQLCIKPHPREHLKDYDRIFPGAYIFKLKVPLQLLLCIMGDNFKTVYTISSTAISDILSFKEDVNVIFAGSQVHPNIVKRYGIISKNTLLQK